jgi:hypothetical protein
MARTAGRAVPNAAGGAADAGAEEQDMPILCVGGIAELPGLSTVAGGYVLDFGTNGTAFFLGVRDQIRARTMT